jgi:hypothetical protein
LNFKDPLKTKDPETQASETTEGKEPPATLPFREEHRGQSQSAKSGAKGKRASKPVKKNFPIH